MVTLSGVTMFLKPLSKASHQRGRQRQDAMTKLGVSYRAPTRWNLGMRAHQLFLAFAALCLAGCASSPDDKLMSPAAIVAPYDTSRGEVLWAVAPLRNESGTSLVNIGAISDKLVNAVEE